SCWACSPTRFKGHSNALSAVGRGALRDKRGLTMIKRKILDAIARVFDTVPQGDDRLLAEGLLTRDTLLEIILSEYLVRFERMCSPGQLGRLEQQYLSRFPEYAAGLQEQFDCDRELLELGVEIGQDRPCANGQAGPLPPLSPQPQPEVFPEHRQD